MLAEHPRTIGGIPLRALLPNAITAMALCFGLTGIRFAIAAAGPAGTQGDWEKAIGAIVIAGLLDGLDGRIARLLKAQSRFGAELDSLSDVIAFGVSPALILYLWSMQNFPQFGWIFALAFVVCAALRLARFNAQIDVEDQPHKSAGFLTGIPAPAGAGAAFLPLYLWIITGNDWFREPIVVAPWLGLIAVLMISNVATFSWGLVRVRRTIRLEAILLVALIGAALFSDPWLTLAVITIGYMALIPFSIWRYAKLKRSLTKAPSA
jgi:CDP-diacylglycerol---serine O-phosphatidyltransferase